MPVSPALCRLLRVREIEEEQHRFALDTALSQLNALQTAFAASRERARVGKVLLAGSFAAGITDRAAAEVEIEAAARRSAALAPRIAAAELAAVRARESYLDKRRERRQVETLIEEARVREEAESDRRSQQGIDDAFVARRQRNNSEAEARENQNSARTNPSGHRSIGREIEQERCDDAFALPQSGTESNL